MPTTTASLRWPKELPPGQFIGRSYSTVEPMMRSTLVGGRARQRREFTSTPTMVPVSWLMTSPQAVYFETWFRWALKDGAEWLEMPLRMPDGLVDRTVRFTGIYDGPTEAGPNHWRFSAELEIRERQTLPPGWELMPGFILEADVIDRAANLEWPEFIFDYATYAEALADLGSLSTGDVVTIRTDETQGGNPSSYEAYVAPPSTLILDFTNDAYYVYDKTSTLTLVTVWAQ